MKKIIIITLIISFVMNIIGCIVITPEIPKKEDLKKKEEVNEEPIATFIIEEPISGSFPDRNIKCNRLPINLILKNCLTGDYMMRCTITNAKVKDYEENTKVFVLSIELENLYYKEKDFRLCHTGSYWDVFHLKTKEGKDITGSETMPFLFMNNLQPGQIRTGNIIWFIQKSSKITEITGVVFGCMYKRENKLTDEIFIEFKEPIKVNF